MDETETTPPEETAPAEAAQPEPTEPTEDVKAEPAPLTASDLTKLREDLNVELVAARKAAQRAESKSDVVEKKLLQRVQRLDTMLEAIATRGMEEPEARAWKAERALERANEAQTEVSTQQQGEAAWRDFQTRGAVLLDQEGIARDDPRLTAAFTKYAQSAESTKDWDIALIRAVADVHKDERKKASEETKTVAEKTREEERNKQKNEKRQGEGKTDTGSPASGAPKDWNAASDSEVLAELQRRRDRRARAGLS